MTNIFTLYNQANINLKEYLENHYSIEWIKQGSSFKSLCPFHADTTPSLFYNSKKNNFKCMSCGTSGDLINYVEKVDNLSNIQACKKILRNENIYFEEDSTKDLSPEELEKKEQEEKQRQKELEAKKRQKEEEEKKRKEQTIKKLTIKAENFSKKFEEIYPVIYDDVINLFPNQSTTFLDWMQQYVGFDSFQNSICILNRIQKDNLCFNIKHKEKYIFNETTKEFDTNKRAEGKWISSYYSTTKPFPLDYFKQHEDNRVIICEGEKDALNLLSYNINCLTLGGVTNNWEEHKHLLKNKHIYIWFDNDKAGYIEAVKKYRQLENVASSIYIVLFFSINNNLANKYDISDYLKEKNFSKKEEIFENIRYSSFILTNDILDEISDFTEINLKELDKGKKDGDIFIYKKSSLKEFEDIRKIFLKTDANGQTLNIFQAKGELDNKYVDDIISNFKNISKNKTYQDFKETFLNSMLIGSENIEKDFAILEKAFLEFSSVKQTLLTNYRQTHIVDMVNAFIKMANHTGFTFGEYKNSLCIWTGTHFKIVNDAQIIKFVMNDWFYHAKIDIKKQTEKNALELISNVRAKSLNIDEIKKKNEDKRVLNLLNGTLFITKRGKIVFKDRHDKFDGSTNILKFSYDETATCPKWNKFLNRVLPNPKEQEALMQYIGYTLLPTHAYETFLLLYGKSGANGKSVIMDTVSNFFGIENISSIDLQQFYGHELEAISNKFINIGTEIDANGLDKGQLSMLKKLVSPKDKIPINPKNKTPYQLESYEKPKLIFSANKKPKQGMDDAVFRRMLLLTFDSEIKDEEKIRDLSDRFKDELSGILNLALKALQTLISNGKFTKSARMLNEIEEYKDDINPIRKYVSENIELDTNYMIPKRYLYSHYKEWVEAKGHKSLNEQNFWKKIKEELPSIDTAGKQKSLNSCKALDGLPRCVEGIYCNSNEVASFTLDKENIKTSDINIHIRLKIPVERERKWINLTFIKN